MIKKALFIIALFVLALTEDVDPEVQALCDIKNALNPYLWRDNVHSPCDMKAPCEYIFAGVVCDEENKHVVKLNLYTNGLRGNLPSSIVNLVHLQVLDMRGNQIFGTLPDLSALTQLETLDFSTTMIDSGVIPEWICNLKSLKHLGLGDTRRTGVFPSCLYKININTLNLADNLLEGSLQDFFNNYSTLQSFDISNNYKLSSINPSSILCKSSSTGLHHLILSNCNLEGTLENCANTTLTNLNTLDLSSNQLNGLIPFDFIKAVPLISLNLGSNKFEGKFSDISVETCDVSYNTLDCSSSTCGCTVGQNYNGYIPKYSTSKNAVIITFCILSAIGFIAVFGFFSYREYRKENTQEYHLISG